MHQSQYKSPMTPSAKVCILAILIFFSVAFLLPPPNAHAASGDSDQQKNEIEKGIKQTTINIGRLKEGIKHQEEQIRETKKVELTLLTEMQDIDSRLTEQNYKIETLESRMNKQQELVFEKKAEMNEAASLMEGVQSHVTRRMQAFYKLGEFGLIHIGFSDQTLPELLSFQDSFLAMIKYDHSLIDTYRTTISELGQAIDSLRLQEDIFEELLVENLEEQEKLDGLKQEKERLLDRIRTQAKLHEKAAAEMEAAAEKLTARLQGLKEQEKRIDQGFLYNKGAHPPPVAGTIIARFNEETTNLLGISSISKGIAIDAPIGSTVKAVDEGVVKYSGYLRGYGNTVIVNHGHQYYSINSRMERLLVEKGQRVDRGTEIGIMGETATLLTPGLYFELRKDTDYLDPLDWLDTAGLK
ncbi:MAG: peptidoglycan DD-metalloendopeptidase family protein [Desulfofustis sp.]|nr:peptidoglycan DD-metalloendopeptidase family protein [Desulfofustis sp.]